MVLLHGIAGFNWKYCGLELKQYCKKIHKNQNDVENVDNCGCNYSHFYSLFIKFVYINRGKKPEIVEKYSNSTKKTIKLWIKNWQKIHFVAKNG